MNELLNFEKRDPIFGALMDGVISPGVFGTTQTSGRVHEVRVKSKSSDNGQVCAKVALWTSEADGEVHEETIPLGNATRRKKFADGCITALKNTLNSSEEEQLRKTIEHRLLSELRLNQQLKAIQAQSLTLTPADRLTEDEKKKAQAILKTPNLLYRVGQTLESLGFVGDTTNALLLYLVLTSRLQPKIISAMIKAESSSGKSFLVDSVLKLFPPEAYYFMSGMSKQSLYYDDESYKNRMLIIAEAPGIDNADYTIRTLLSEGKLVFKTVEKNAATGELKSRTIKKEGPTGMILTTTEVRLHPENETRFISLTLDESEEQTGRINLSTARRYTRCGSTQLPLEDWHGAQHLLQPLPVEIPYGEFLAKRAPTKPLRIRRDFGKLLTFISASALLHQEQRRVVDGHIQANLVDYFLVKTLFEKTFFASLFGIPAGCSELMQAIKNVYAEKNAGQTPDPQTGLTMEVLVTTKDLVDRLQWSKPKVCKMAKNLEDFDWVIVGGEGKANEYRPGLEPNPKKSSLPSLKELAEAFPELAEEFEAVHPISGETVKLPVHAVAHASLENFRQISEPSPTVSVVN